MVLIVNIEWISTTDAVALTRKSYSTLRRFIYKHKQDSSIIKREQGSTFINKAALLDTYRASHEHHDTSKAEEAKQHKEAVQIATNAKSIDSISLQLEAKDQQIKEIISRTPKSPLYLTIGFVILISFLIYGGWLYKKELLSYERQKIATLREDGIIQIQQIKQSAKEELKNRQEVINTLKGELSIKREELAKKDRLISELYNDTKAQNKKLLELTESLKNEVIKNEQKNNNLPAKRG